MVWKPCGHLSGQRCDCALWDRQRNRAIARLNRNVREENAEIARGNHRRQLCAEKAMQYAMCGNLKLARSWVARLVAAGFSKNDGAEIEAMDCLGIENAMRDLLGVKKIAHDAARADEGKG